jgi:hypothetical protein
MEPTINRWLYRQMKLGTVKGNGHTYKLYLNHYLFDKAFKYGDGAKFYVMSWQTLNHFEQNPVIFRSLVS